MHLISVYYYMYVIFKYLRHHKCLLNIYYVFVNMIVQIRIVHVFAPGHAINFRWRLLVRGPRLYPSGVPSRTGGNLCLSGNRDSYFRSQPGYNSCSGNECRHLFQGESRCGAMPDAPFVHIFIHLYIFVL